MAIPASPSPSIPRIERHPWMVKDSKLISEPVIHNKAAESKDQSGKEFITSHRAPATPVDFLLFDYRPGHFFPLTGNITLTSNNHPIVIKTKDIGNPIIIQSMKLTSGALGK